METSKDNGIEQHISNSTKEGQPQTNDYSAIYEMQSQLCKNLAKKCNSPRVARRGDIDPVSGVRGSGHRILCPTPPPDESTISSDDCNHGFLTKLTGPNSPSWITVTQSFDITRVMFSRGNVTEKKRFGSLVQPGKSVLYMYDGIGYYTNPALVHGKAMHVTACEWNVHALSALRYPESKSCRK